MIEQLWPAHKMLCGKDSAGFRQPPLTGEEMMACVFGRPSALLSPEIADLESTGIPAHPEIVELLNEEFMSCEEGAPIHKVRHFPH